MKFLVLCALATLVRNYCLYLLDFGSILAIKLVFRFRPLPTTGWNTSWWTIIIPVVYLPMAKRSVNEVLPVIQNLSEK